MELNFRFALLRGMNSCTNHLILFPHEFKVGGDTGRYAAPLNSYVMASLLLKPSDLDRAPRSALLSLAQCLLVVAEVSFNEKNLDTTRVLLPYQLC